MLVGIDLNSFRKGNLYNAPHVGFFFTVWTHCTLMEKVLCQSFSLLYLVKKKPKTNGNTDHQLELLGFF